MVAKYRSVLSVPGSPALILAAMAGRLPLGMSTLAILLLVRETGHSYAIAGISVGAYAFASAASAPVQGRLIDRFGRLRVMVPMALAQAAVLVAFVLVASVDASGAAVVPLAALAGALMPPVSPTARALMRDVYRDPHVRETAYALDSVVQEVVWVTGPLIVALVVGFTSPEVAVLLVAAVCVIGTTLFVRSPLARGSGTRSAHQPRVSVLSDHELRAMLIPIALTGVGLGAIEVGLPSLALHAGSRPASGLLLAVWSLGSLAGGLWYGARAWSSSLSRRYRLLLVAAIAFTAPLIIARTVPEGIIGSLLAGLMIAPVFSCQYAMIARAAPSGAETEAFTWVSAALVAGLAIGSAIGGGLIGVAGVSAPFVFSCLATAVAATIALRTPEPAFALQSSAS
jgi:MFS family permease